jgi:glycosyltransferase involved in cell wall biosynthesis
MRLFGFRVGDSLLQAFTEAAWAAARPLIKRLRDRELRQQQQGLAASGAASARTSAPSAPPRPASRALRPFRIHATILDHLDNRRAAMNAAELGRALARANEYDVVVSSGPPHAAHDAARRIARATKLPLIVDLRDAWVHERLVVPHKLDSQLWRTLQGAVERRCLETARLVLCTTEPMRSALVEGFPRLASRILTVRNGADAEPLPRPSRGRRFLIAYAGNLYAGRDPRLLFRAVSRLARERALTADDIGIEFLGGGEIEGTSIDAIAREEGIPHLVRAHGQRTRLEVLEFLASATMLLSLPQQDTFAIPAKLYEYVQFQAWLLALAPPNSATAQLLAGSGADVVEPDDVDAIAAAVARRFDEYRAGVMPCSINADGRYDRRAQARTLFEAMARTLGV